MKFLSDFWNSLSANHKISIALGFSSFLATVCVCALSGKVAYHLLHSYSDALARNELNEKPFSREAWISDCPWGSRHAMAKGLIRNNSLIGMTDVEVRSYLGFGKGKYDSEAQGQDQSNILIMTVTAWHCEYGAHFYVTIADGKVIETSFSEEY